MFYPRGITLDCPNKRVYWIERDMDIFSSDYDFQHEKKITSGSFSRYMPAIFGHLMYFQKSDALSIYQMNMSNGNKVRSILVDNCKEYVDIIVLHSTLQPMGM